MGNPFVMPNAGSMWVTYVNVDDLRAATVKAKSLGAAVIPDQVEVKGKGSFSIIRSDRRDAGPVARRLTATAYGGSCCRDDTRPFFWHA